MILSENKTSYFKPPFSLPTQVQDSTIDICERKAIIELLGAYSYDEFSNDLVNGIPKSDKWKTFVNGENYTNSNGNKVKYNGIKTLLQAYVYWCVNSNYNYMTGVGNVSPKPENSERSSAVFNQLESDDRYNIFVTEFCSAQAYVLQVNSEIERTATAILDNVDGTYTVTANTDLIEVNSQIEFNNDFYNVSFVDATTFKITASTGLTLPLSFKFRKYNRFKPSAVSDKNIISYG